MNKSLVQSSSMYSVSSEGDIIIYIQVAAVLSFFLIYKYVSQPLTPPVVVEEAAVVSKTGPTPLNMPVVERIEYDSPAAEPVELQTITPESGVLPPPGFPPFLFPENDGGMDADDICARFGGLDR